jgi:hypothetical protein
MQSNKKSMRLQGYSPFNFGFKGITNQQRSTETTDSDKVIKGTIKVVLDIYTLAQG